MHFAAEQVTGSCSPQLDGTIAVLEDSVLQAGRACARAPAHWEAQGQAPIHDLQGSRTELLCRDSVCMQCSRLDDSLQLLGPLTELINLGRQQLDKVRFKLLRDSV